MLIKDAKFVKSSAHYKDCPESSLPEYAFIGRSNVGKSSLINMICDRKSLAKTSSKPGKTQLINHFIINDQWHLVDLPGYGWSKVSKAKKADWGQMIEEYLLRRENLLCVFVLFDSRLEPQEIDYNFLEWLGEKEIPFVLAFTKIDKQSRNQFQSVKARHIKKLKLKWLELPQMFFTSAVKREGAGEILKFIEETNRFYQAG